MTFLDEDSRLLVVEASLAYLPRGPQYYENAASTIIYASRPGVQTTKQLPIRQIRQMISSSDERYKQRGPYCHKKGPLDGVRFAISPELEEILIQYYRAPVERELESANKKVEQLKASARVMEETFRQEKAWSETLTARIDRFNGLSFWAKVKWILKGKEI